MHTYIIAEAGVNHNGSAELAHRLVDAAADAGADAVKFQTFKAAEMATQSVEKAEYQKNSNTRSESQIDMLSRLELDPACHQELKSHAEQRGIDFLSSAFDNFSLDFLTNELSLQTLKISSGELTNHPFLLAHAKTGRNLILSTGMATLAEIEDALSVLAFGFIAKSNINSCTEDRTTPCRTAFREAYLSQQGKQLLKQRLTLLHCTSEYPTRLENVNLSAMQSLHTRFQVPTGYSDHTLGVIVASLVVAAGGQVLEKHFTLDQKMPGPDHAMSLNPNTLKAYIAAAREAEIVMGSPEKQPTAGEMKNRFIGRKVIVAKKDIAMHEILDESSIGLKRCGNNGLAPSQYWDLLGKQATRKIARDTAITQSLIE